MKQTETALKDIGEIRIDESLPLRERREAFLEQIGDPCHFRYKGITVTVVYSDDGHSFQDCLEEYMQSEAF